MAPNKKRPALNKTDGYFWNILRSSIMHRAEENWQWLLQEPSFTNRLNNARKLLRIPDNLRPESDGYAQLAPLDEGDVDLIESKWVDSLSRDRQKEFESEIKALLIEFKLTIDFDDHIRYWLLYRKPPNWNAPLGVEHAQYVIANPQEMMRVPLTTQERNMVKAELRKRFGVQNGRPPKGSAAVYKRLLDILNNMPRNKSRRSLTFGETLAVISSKRQNNSDTARPCSKTYGDVADEIYPELLDKIAENKNRRKIMKGVKSKIRVRVFRFKKRHSRK